MNHNYLEQNVVYLIKYSGGTRANKWRPVLVVSEDSIHYCVFDLEISAYRTYRKERMVNFSKLPSGVISFSSEPTEQMLSLMLEEIGNDGYKQHYYLTDTNTLVYWNNKDGFTVEASIDLVSYATKTIRPMRFEGTLEGLSKYVNNLIEEYS